ncbi:MAG: ABC transporter permease [Acidobacteria bacterium]|nr:ABC transporter permease [Acidobacteriota bacterium]
MAKYHPLKELLKSRMREFVREPETIFWVYGFPVLIALGLGIAFSNRPADRVFVDVVQHARAEVIVEDLRRDPGFDVAIHEESECRERLRLGKSVIVVVPGDGISYLYDPTRPESVLARQRVDDTLQRAAGRSDPIETEDRHVTEPGNRYIDFLIPGLLGMNLLGGSLWGVGYAIVDMRVRKLLKRLTATPMKRTHFLVALVGGRLVFMIPEMIVILSAGVLFFDVPIRGSIFSIFILALLAASSFTGMGLLVACRAKKLETVSGLMNLIQLPMYLLSGVFFSPDRFPDLMQIPIQALPLTQFNYAMREIILEGSSIFSQGWSLGIIALWGVVSFLFTMRLFRWN